MLIPGPIAQSEAIRALAEIRSVVDRSTRYSTFSALSGFLAGAAALVGSGLCGRWTHFPGASPDDWNFVKVWAGVFIFAAVQYAFLTALKARKRGEAFWTPIARTAFKALLGPFIAGALGTLALSISSGFEFLPGLWLILYGCGLWAVSFFAPTFLRWLGVAFMILGTAAFFHKAESGFFLGLGFGVLHMIFGIVVLTRYQK